MTSSIHIRDAKIKQMLPIIKIYIDRKVPNLVNIFFKPIRR